MEQRRATTLGSLVDEGSFRPTREPSPTPDPLEWPGYKEALDQARGPSGAAEAVVAGSATIGGHLVEVAVFDFSFFGGSIGSVAGEELAVALERAVARGRPLVLRTATGGARIQEGMAALVQMPKLVAARLQLAAAHVPLIAILGHPTTGGVLASLAALADVTIAEQDAAIGFAGPRIVQRFTGRPVAGSHTAATALAAGLVDAVVPPDQVRHTVAHVLEVLAVDDSLESAPASGSPTRRDAGGARQYGGQANAWAAVQSSRSAERPRGPDLLRQILDPHAVLHGDRAGREDPALVVAVGRLQGRRVMAFDRSFAPGPSAYRKATRCIEIAVRLELPVVTLIDTPGANPSEASENGGIAWAIAEVFSSLLTAPIPVLSVVTGEGGSGGALALATADVLLTYAGATFSVIGPEMAAEILWRDPARAPEAAALLRPTAADLLGLGIADEIVPEPLEPGSLADVVAYHLGRIGHISGEELAEARRRRWRDRGKQAEAGTPEA